MLTPPADLNAVGPNYLLTPAAPLLTSLAACPHTLNIGVDTNPNCGVLNIKNSSPQTCPHNNTRGLTCQVRANSLGHKITKYV